MNELVLSAAFGSTKPDSNLLIPFMRVRETGQVVRLARYEVSENEAWYDESLHKGHVTCGGCDASVHVRKGTPVVAGGNKPSIKEHIVTNPGSSHDRECEFGKERRFRFNTQPDKNLPVRVHVNVPIMPDRLDGKYNKTKAGDNKTPYTSDGVVKISEAELSRRECFNINAIGDFIDLYNRIDLNRIYGGTFIHLGHQYDGRRIITSYVDNGDGFRVLAAHLSGSRGSVQPVLMQMVIPEGLSEDSDRLVSTPLYFKKRAGYRAPVEIHPAMYIDTKDSRVREMCSTAGEFWIYGFAGLRPKPTHNKGESIYHIAVSIRDISQIVRVDPQDPRLRGKKLRIPVLTP